MSSLEKWLFRSSAYFLNRLFFLILSCESCLYSWSINPLSYILFANIFSHSVGCLHFINGFLCWTKAFKFNQILFVYFLFCFPCLRRQTPKKKKKNIAKTCQRVYCLWFLLLLLLSHFSRVQLRDPRDGSPSGFPVPGILQARTLEWVAISFSNA